MIGKEFRGILTKYTNIPPSGDNEPCVQIVIKHTNYGDIQRLMGHFEKALDTTHIQNVFAYPVMWSKMTFDVANYHPNYYLVEFDEMEFHARLQKIEVTKKNVEGIDSFEYNFHFKKEISDEDGKTAYIYLKHKEEDDDGKKVLVEYPTTINLADEPQDTSANADIL
jgi:hypothetical protein